MGAQSRVGAFESQRLFMKKKKASSANTMAQNKEQTLLFEAWQGPSSIFSGKLQMHTSHAFVSC